jgi:hypothetical protein
MLAGSEAGNLEDIEPRLPLNFVAIPAISLCYAGTLMDREAAAAAYVMSG